MPKSGERRSQGPATWPRKFFYFFKLHSLFLASRNNVITIYCNFYKNFNHRCIDYRATMVDTLTQIKAKPISLTGKSEHSMGMTIQINTDSAWMGNLYVLFDYHKLISLEFWFGGPSVTNFVEVNLGTVLAKLHHGTFWRRILMVFIELLILFWKYYGLGLMT